MQGFSFGEPSERTPLLRDDLASSASASMSPDKFGGSRWSVVTTPGAVPSRSAHAVQISKHLPTSEVLPDGHLHDWMEDTKWSTIGRERVIRNVGGTIYEAWYRVQGWVAVLIIGVLVGTIGAMIHISALWVHGLTRGVCVDAWYLPALYCEVWGYSSEPPNGFHHWPTVLGVSGTSFGNKLAAFLYVFMSCLLTLIASWLVVNLAPKAAGAGVPEIKTILGGAEINGFSTVTTGLVKWVALVFAVGGSLSIGKAAPLMHVAFNVGDCVASCFEKYRNSMGKRRELLTSATAAGVCVAFGAPLGGVLYAFEETSTFFSAQTLVRSFTCSVIAGATLQAWDPFLHGKLTLFAINYHVAWKLWELPFFALVGALGGLVGHSFNIIHLKVASWRKTRTPINPIMEVFVVTLVTTVLQVYMLPSGFHRTDAEYLQMLFRHCDSESDVIRCPMNLTLAVTLGILKFWLTALSFGMMVPAGLFMPNLVIGACMGWTFGTLLDDMVSDNHLMFRTFTDCTAQDLNCVVPSVYAIVAATAVMGGVNRMTLSLVTIMFELTGGLEYIIPVTIGVMCSKWVAEWLGGKESIYNKLMDVKGLPFLDPRFEGRMDITSHASIGEIMSLSTADLPLLYERMTTKETLEVLKTSATGFVIVKNEMDHRIVGYISRRQLSMALEDLDGELSEMGMMAQDDIPVVFGANGNIAPETPKFLMKRTPSVLRSDSSQVSRFAYDLHGYVDHSPVTVRKEVEVARVVLMIRRLGLTTILVADESNILKGVLTKLEVIKHLHKVHEYSERAEREYASCPRGPPLASSTKDHPKGGFHQSELEAEVHSISELEHLPALPPAAMIIRRKSARPKK